jgi:PIN domain nuclease of toxin-antitoxin system
LRESLDADTQAVQARYPLGRLLIAQAMVEGIDLISHGPAFGNYSVPVHW